MGISSSEPKTVPAFYGEAVTPSDSVNLSKSDDVRALYIGGAGNVACEMESGTVVFSSVPAGTILPINTSRVNDTNTTATNIVVLY